MKYTCQSCHFNRLKSAKYGNEPAGTRGRNPWQVGESAGKVRKTVRNFTARKTSLGEARGGISGFAAKRFRARTHSRQLRRLSVFRVKLVPRPKLEPEHQDTHRVTWTNMPMDHNELNIMSYQVRRRARDLIPNLLFSRLSLPSY